MNFCPYKVTKETNEKTEKTKQLPAQVPLKEVQIASPKDEQREKDKGLHKIMLLKIYV